MSRGLNLSEIKMVYPLAAIPGWVASRYFYASAGKVASLPARAVAGGVRSLPVYRLLCEVLHRSSNTLGPRELFRIHELFIDLTFLGLVILLIFAVFFAVIRHGTPPLQRAQAAPAAFGGSQPRARFG